MPHERTRAAALGNYTIDLGLKAVGSTESNNSCEILVTNENKKTIGKLTVQTRDESAFKEIKCKIVKVFTGSNNSMTIQKNIIQTRLNEYSFNQLFVKWKLDATESINFNAQWIPTDNAKTYRQNLHKELISAYEDQIGPSKLPVFLYWMKTLPLIAKVIPIQIQIMWS